MVHKLLLELVIDKKKLLENDYYDKISSREWNQNKAKPLEELVDGRKVTFVYYKNGKIGIWIACNEKPFSIETEDDILILESFFGQLRDRIEYHISDPKGRLVQSVPLWILKQCDLNKDIPITDKAQMSLPDIQLSTASRVFRLYVKNLNGEPHYRIEDSLRVNESLRFLKSILNPYDDTRNKSVYFIPRIQK